MASTLELDGNLKSKTVASQQSETATPLLRPVRVLYSFPHKLGADRICYTAWQQVNGLVNAGAEVLLFPGVLSRPVPVAVNVYPTLAYGPLRVPYKLLGKLRSMKLHDRIVAHRLRRLAGKIDIVHVWPSAALETIEVARQLGIPTVLERPNAHTRFCYEIVAAEHERVGMKTPHFDYRPNEALLAREETEFEKCDFLLCASEFAAKSFIDRGYPESKILRHRYGFDPDKYFLAKQSSRRDMRFTALFVGVDAVRKGLHIALEAWLASSAAKDGVFQIAGELTNEFKVRFARQLADDSVVELGHRNDVARLMQSADILLMPSIEEGFGLVCAEAIGAGCVPLASDACTEMCRHLENSLVHKAGDVMTLRRQISAVHDDPVLLARLRAGALESCCEWTWDAAGRVLLQAYKRAVLNSAVARVESWARQSH